MDAAREMRPTADAAKPLTLLHRRRYPCAVLATTRRALVALALALGVGRVEAVPCAAECGRRLTECRSTQCEGLSPKSCRDRCRAITGCRAGGARVGVVATVVTKCRTIGDRWTGEQRLEVRRGDCRPTTIVSFTSDTVTGGILCDLFGQFRDGGVAEILAPLQRLGLSPDGRTLLFEVSTHSVNDSLPGPKFAVAEEGIFAVRPDGSHLRRLGPPSRERQYKGPIFGYKFYPGFNIAGGDDFSFSPDGRFVVFSDRGPGADGTDAGQLVVMNVQSGDRTQVTRLSAATQDAPTGGDVFGFFVDDDTIGGATRRVHPDDKTTYTEQQFLVRRDGSDFRPFVRPIDVPGGGKVVENFQVAGREGNVVTVEMETMADEPRDPGRAHEVWARERNQLVQLTKIDRTDTWGGVLSRDGQRVFFNASTDRYGPNPMKNCQLFSVPRLGGAIRQLTRYDPPIYSLDGCNRNAPFPGCRIQEFHIDSETGSLVFRWSCDPFGLSPTGSQLFAMRPDGSGFRQLTAYAGLRDEPDGGKSVELPGPVVFSTRDQSAGHGHATNRR